LDDILDIFFLDVLDLAVGWSQSQGLGGHPGKIREVRKGGSRRYVRFAHPEALNGE
jgi:hypothetical protein